MMHNENRGFTRLHGVPCFKSVGWELAAQNTESQRRSGGRRALRRIKSQIRPPMRASWIYHFTNTHGAAPGISGPARSLVCDPIWG